MTETPLTKYQSNTLSYLSDIGPEAALKLDASIKLRAAFTHLAKAGYIRNRALTPKGNGFLVFRPCDFCEARVAEPCLSAQEASTCINMPQTPILKDISC